MKFVKKKPHFFGDLLEIPPDAARENSERRFLSRAEILQPHFNNQFHHQLICQLFQISC